MKILKWFGKALILGILLLILMGIALQFPAVQTKAVQYISTKLSKTLKTKVSVQQVNIQFFKTVSLKEVLIQDQKKDTLIFAEALDINIGLLSMLNNNLFLNDIQLKNARIKCSRSATDSLYNYDFLLDAFTSDETKENDDANNNWTFGIKQIALQNISLQFVDDYGGLEWRTQIADFSTHIHQLDLENQRLEFVDLTLKETEVEYLQKQASNLFLKTKSTSTLNPTEIQFPFSGWNLAAKNLVIENSSVSIKEIDNSFDENSKTDYAFSKIQLNVQNFLWEKEVLTANLKNLQFQEKNGFQLNHFTTQLNASPTQIALQTFTLETPNSNVQINSNVKFNSFNDLINNYQKLDFSSEFSDTKIGVEDLAYFFDLRNDISKLDLTKQEAFFLDGSISGSLKQIQATSFFLKLDDVLNLKFSGLIESPTSLSLFRFNLEIQELTSSYEQARSILNEEVLPKELKQFGKLTLNGKMQGDISEINFQELNLSTEANSGFDISGSIKNYSSFQNSTLDLNITKFFTDGKILNGFSKNKLPKLDSLGQISYQGTYGGSLTKFDLKGTLKSAIGTLESDVFMDFKSDYSTANYKGALRLDAFQLDKVLGDSLQLGEVTLNADIIGDGFKLDSMNTNMNLHIEKINYADYEYKDIFVEGLLNQAVFVGKFNLNDPNAKLDFNGKISFAEHEPVYQFTMLVDTLNLQALNLRTEQLGVTANLNMNFSGQQINDFDGNMNISDIYINNQGKVFHNDSLTIKSIPKSNNKRSLSIDAPFLNGQVNGDYDFDELYNVLLIILNEYFPMQLFSSESQASIDLMEVKKPQNFDFNFALKDAAPIILFLPQLKAMESADLSGYLDSENNILETNLQIKKILLEGMSIDAIDFNSIGNRNRLSTFITASELKTESINVSQIDFKSQMLNDSIYFNVDVKNDSTNQLLNFSAIVEGGENDYHLKFDEDVIANNNKWKINDQNNIHFSPDILNIDKLEFSNDKQSIAIQSLAPKKNEPVPPIQISFDNFQIGEISKMANIENTNYTGQVNGQFKIIDPLNKLHYNADLNIPNLTLNEEPVGALSIGISQLAESPTIDVNIALKGQSNSLDISGNYNSSSQLYNIKADIPTLEFRLLDPVMEGVFGDSNGSLSGNFSLNGTPKKPILLGGFDLHEVSTTIDFTNTRYLINKGNIKFDNQEINLGTLLLKDRRGDLATLKGKINHDFFTNMRFDLNIDTEQFTFLKTEAKDNELFYGKLFLKAFANIRGPVTQPNVDITAKTLQDSELNISAFSETDNFLDENYIIFGNPSTFQETKEQEFVYEIQRSIPAEVNLNLEITDQSN